MDTDNKPKSLNIHNTHDDYKTHNGGQNKGNDSWLNN